MKKILFIIDSLGGGGAERVLIDNLNYLKDKCDLHLWVFLYEGALINQVPSHVKLNFAFDTSDLINRNIFFRFYIRVVFKLMRLFPFFISSFLKLKEDYDVGVSAYEGFSTIMLATNKKHFKKTIAHIHNDFIYHKPIVESNDLLEAYKLIDEFAFVSDDSLLGFNNYFALSWLTQKKQIVLYNPVNVEKVLLKAKEPIVYTKTKFLIVSSGRLVKIKGFDKLIINAKKLIDKGIDFELLILGAGPEKENLESLIQKNNLQNCVKLLGFCANPYPYIDLADLFAFVSDHEGYPMVIAEAMVLKKPILATNVTGTRNILNNGEFGYLVDNNEYDIYKGLLEMVTNDSIRNYYADYLHKKWDTLPFTDAFKKTESYFLD